MSKINLNNYEAFLLDYSEGNLSALEIAELKAFAIAHPQLEIDLDNFELPYFSEEPAGIDFISELKKTEQDVQTEELINYIENNLSAGQKAAFEAKLLLNKNLAKELELYKKTILTADLTEQSNLITSLAKTEEDLILNNQVIAYLENQLSTVERTEFETVVANDALLLAELNLYSKTILTADSSVIFPYKKELKKEARIISLFNFRRIATMAAAVLLLIGLAFVFNYYGSKEQNKGSLASKNSSQRRGITPTIKTPVKPNDKIKQEPSVEKHVASKEKSPERLTEKTLKENEVKDSVITKIKNEPGLPQIVKEENKERLVNPAIEKRSGPVLESAPIASVYNPDTVLNSVNNLFDLDELDEESAALKGQNKKGLWKRVVQLAQQANKLGVKSVDGEENDSHNYRLSFNSFSVEKK
jgi:hypothetical protein